MADKVHISREVPGPATAPSGEGSPHQLGLTAAMALIVGSIIGVSIFQRRHMSQPAPVPPYRDVERGG